MVKEIPFKKGQIIYDLGEVMIWQEFEYMIFDPREDRNQWNKINVNGKINNKYLKKGHVIREGKRLLLEVNNPPKLDGVLRLTYLK